MLTGFAQQWLSVLGTSKSVVGASNSAFLAEARKPGQTDDNMQFSGFSFFFRYYQQDRSKFLRFALFRRGVRLQLLFHSDSACCIRAQQAEALLHTRF